MSTSSSRQKLPPSIILPSSPALSRYPSFPSPGTPETCASNLNDNTYFLEPSSGKPVRNVTSVTLETLIAQEAAAEASSSSSTGASELFRPPYGNTKHVKNVRSHSAMSRARPRANSTTSSVYSRGYDYRYDDPSWVRPNMRNDGPGPAETRPMMQDQDEPDYEELLQARRIRQLNEFVNRPRRITRQQQLKQRQALARFRILWIGISLGVMMFLVIMSIIIALMLKGKNVKLKDFKPKGF
ncbi:hypothetical protein BDD12DRAFT_808820 [Trichophaea hybrida]|nr:hypothetical protein BDD12DRAFT_808820 [Trichophaea hybrida]